MKNIFRKESKKMFLSQNRIQLNFPVLFLWRFVNFLRDNFWHETTRPVFCESEHCRIFW